VAVGVASEAEAEQGAVIYWRNPDPEEAESAVVERRTGPEA
jgi:hypothetical protein